MHRDSEWAHMASKRVSRARSHSGSRKLAMRRMLVNRLSSSAALLALAALVAPAWADEAVQVDAKIPHYKKVQGVSGNLSAIGSDTMNNLMTLWAEGFRKIYPGVNMQVEGKGSSTAPPALVAGTAQLGPMSRDMKAEEIDAFEKKYGFKP